MPFAPSLTKLRGLAAAILLALLTGCAAPPPPHIPRSCGKLDDMLRLLNQNALYAYTATAIDYKEQVHEWYVNSTLGIWVELHVYDDLHACIENQGTDWQWAAPPGLKH